MGSCTRCGKHWSGSYSACPDDGAALVPDQPSRRISGSLALADDANDELAPGTLAGDYRIERKLGEGAMGAVYGGRHTLIGKRAAIKVIRGELSASKNAVDRFVFEAQAVNEIGHPNIVDVFDFGTLDDGRSFFVMEWLDGETLRSRMTRRLGYVEALELVETIAKALQAAHAAGVVHRDLKPDNVYLANVQDDRPAVKLLDFGVAKLSRNIEQRIERTRTGVVLGTPLYISPEQAKGTHVDSAADVYSLGAIAYEMFTGHVPFMADSSVEIMSLHITTPPRPPHQVAPGLPAELDALILAMLAKDPSRRPTAAQVRGAVSAMRARVSAPLVAGASTLPPTPPTAPVERRGSRRFAVIAVAFVVTVIAAVTAYVATRGPTVDDVPSVIAPAPLAQPVVSDAAEIAVVTPDAATPATATVTIDAASVVETTGSSATPVVAVKPVAPRLGTVVVTIVGGARGQIAVDGHVVATHAASASIELSGGEHEIYVTAPGHFPAGKQVRVVAGAKQQIEMAPPLDPNAVHSPYGDD